MASMSTNKQRVNVTLEPQVIQAVRDLAARERRSFSAQMQLLIEQALANQPKENNP